MVISVVCILAEFKKLNKNTKNLNFNIGGADTG